MLIRWITKHIGTGAYTKAQPEFNDVIVDVRGLVDGGGNQVEEVKLLIQQALAALSQEKRVLVCCGYGISRSNAIATGVVSISQGIGFNDALDLTIAQTGEQNMRLELIDIVRRAVAEISGIKGGRNTDPGTVLLLGVDPLSEACFQRLTNEFDVIVPATMHSRQGKDIVDLEKLLSSHQVGTVVHLARPSVCNINSAMGEALAVLKNIADLCIVKNARLITRSDASVFAGYAGELTRVTSQQTRKPHGVWGETMHLSECLLEQVCSTAGLAYAALRFPAIYIGPLRSPAFLAEFAHKARNDITINVHAFKDGEAAVDLIGLADATEAICHAVRYPQLTGGINLGSGRAFNVGELARLITDKLGSQKALTSTRIDRPAPIIKMGSETMSNTTGWAASMDVLALIENDLSINPAHTESNNSDYG